MYSIIIPTCNRASLLALTLESIAVAVKPDDPVEIIIVDNGSRDKTAKTCSGIKEKFPRHDWRYFYDSMPGLLTGRHRGANEARGEILCYLDDDVLVGPGWLHSLTEAFQDGQVALVGGPSSPKYEIEPPMWVNGLWSEFEGGRSCGPLSLINLGPSIKPTSSLLIWGLNFSIRKSVLQDCGGFHPDCIPKVLQRYQGDGETGLSLKIEAAADLRVIYHPMVAVIHVIPGSRLTPEYFEQRAFYQGVCDSYTQIRRDRAVPLPRKASWKDLLRPSKWRLERKMLLRNLTAESVRRLMTRAHFEGMEFHRNEVRLDPKLLEWVLRDNYFEYGLPDGWEAYLKSRAA